MKIRDLRNGDWYWIQKTVYKNYASKIGAIGLALYNSYCHYANNNTAIAYPSIKTLTIDLKISRQTIFKYNEILVKHGLVEIKSGGGREKVNEVYLLKIKVNDVTEKVNLATEKVNDVDTEQELITRINNNSDLNFSKARRKAADVRKRLPEILGGQTAQKTNGESTRDRQVSGDLPGDGKARGEGKDSSVVLQIEPPLGTHRPNEI